jgi:hypothetical protein
MLFLHHAGKMSSIPPPAAIVVVARRWKEYHVVAAVEGHELKTPETEHRPGPEWLLETAHLELDGKLFVSTQQAPTWRANCRRFETGGSLSRRVSVPRAPAQTGRARGRARRGEASRPETGVREVEIPRPSCSSRAQVGCACSRGLQASTRVREASGPKRAPVPSSSPRGQLSAFRDRGVPKPTSECAACPSPDGSSAWASAKGGSEVAGVGREIGGNPAAFVFVPRPGRVRLQ